MNDSGNESPLAPSGVQQIYAPRRKVVASFGGGAGSVAQQTVFVRMTIPDSRLRAKFTLRATPRSDRNAGAAVLSTRALKLWIYEEEEDQLMGGRFDACTDLAGSTGAAPISLPANSGLGGFSREFDTAADAIGARITVPAQAPGGIAGDLVLQARFQPGAFRFIPIDEWEQIKSLCAIDVLTPPIVVP